MSHYLIVGQKFSPLSEYILEHGDTYTLLQDVKKTKFPEKKFKRRIVADFSSRDSVIAAVDTVKQPVDGVITVYENYIVAAAWISEYLGLPGLPVHVAEACTDKYLMRSLFAKASEKISPAFAEITSEAQVRSFAEQHGFPLILKPANLAKSLLVTKNDNMDELVANYRKSTELLQSTYKKYASSRTPKLIIEEFMEGSVHSVDAFVDGSGVPQVLEQVVDYQTGYDIGYDDNFHYSRTIPSALSSSEQAALRHCADVGIRALGMKNSPAHVEIIMTKDGPRIVEIGARNGGYRERMHRLANDIDITAAALQLTLGKPANITATKNGSCAVMELFPKTPGTYKTISELAALKQLPSLEYLSIKAKAGEYVGKSADGFRAVAIVILASDDREQFLRDVAFLDTSCHVVTQPTH